MSHNEKDPLAPPPYSESSSSRTFSPSRGQSIVDQLTLTRTHHLQSVIDTNIISIIENQALHGIASTTIAMIPSDVPLPALKEKSEFSFDTGDDKPVEVIGFASDESPKVVRLEGQLNRTEFWKAQGVVSELERILKETLSPEDASRSRAPVEVEPAQPQQTSRRKFFSKFVPSMGPEQRSPAGNPEVGVRAFENLDAVRVRARLEELCLRTENEFGLYDTLTRQRYALFLAGAREMTDSEVLKSLKESKKEGLRERSVRQGEEAEITVK